MFSSLKGFKVLNWGDGGWVRVFSKEPVSTPDDLKRMKLFTSIGDPKTESLYKQFGFQVVPLSMVDLVTSLQTGMIDAIPNVPLFAQLQELHKLTPHMLNVKLTPRSTAGRHSLPGVALDLHAVVHVVHPQDLRVSTIRP